MDLPGRLKTTIRLRDVEPADLPTFFEDQRDPEAVAMVAFHSRDRAAFDQHWAKIQADETNLIKTIVVDNQVAGNIGCWTTDGKREVGYWINRAFWGRGVATEALSALLRLERIRPLYAGVAKHNAASLRVLQKRGFRFLPADGSSKGAEDSHFLLTLTGEWNSETRK